THEPQQMVAQTSRNEDRSVSTPAAAEMPKPKTSDNDDAVVQPKAATIPAATKETPNVETKNETSERKPAEMKVANGFDRNPYLPSIVKPLLPPKTTVMDAAMGFKSQRQFIAAVHVSRNLNIPFSQFKTRMTAEHRMSLNDSLRDIRPEMTKNLAKAEVH